MRKSIIFIIMLGAFAVTSCHRNFQSQVTDETDTENLVGYVNPYMGSISHLLVPAFPTVHLPNSMMRVHPERDDFTRVQLRGLPVISPFHRGGSVFHISPVNDLSTADLQPVKSYSYDLEKVTPHDYHVYLDEEQIEVNYATAHKSAIYSFDFEKEGTHAIIIQVNEGSLAANDHAVSGEYILSRDGRFAGKVYLHLETCPLPLSVGVLRDGKKTTDSLASGKEQALVIKFAPDVKNISMKYGVSLISTSQAKKNLQQEIPDYQWTTVSRKGRNLWNETLKKIQVTGGTPQDKTVFYTSFYRTCERMIDITEDGIYYSPFDRKIHETDGVPFYIDDWVWDTYRAAHPLRVLLDNEMESAMVTSYIRAAQQDSIHGWMPTFPEMTGDSHCMNGNHAVAVVLDAYVKGIRDFDLEAAYQSCRATMLEKSWLPWTKIPATPYDRFFMEKGYFPALKPGEPETIKGVSNWEKRQPVAVTLGACYDFWCLAQLAKILGYENDYRDFLQKSRNYRHLYNPETAFFHPKDKDGQFITPFDYRYSSGPGAREYYDENNAYIFQWDVPHDIEGLIALMGGEKTFVENLDQMFREPLGKSKNEFYAQLPDHTGNVGQFSMSNETALAIPYLYNYGKQPWKTQKCIRELLKEWFRDDLMGIPGDEDGGGLSAFVVFSCMGFYPVTPGTPVYNIGSPVFKNVKIAMGNGKIFEIDTRNYAPDHKYIQSAMLNGKPWNNTWLSHEDIANGGILVLEMGKKANRTWGKTIPENKVKE
ncbi:MAG: glycoside hydrolase family 92 protein [Bacteroidales bacterium]|jgi:predicted alpha-1,2-mannosidase|nr:glycoside hydrolase family 92 protein [Bacteroidales bacterium]